MTVANARVVMSGSDNDIIGSHAYVGYVYKLPQKMIFRHSEIGSTRSSCRCEDLFHLSVGPRRKDR